MPPLFAHRMLSRLLPDFGGWTLERIAVDAPIRFAWRDLPTVRGARRAYSLQDVRYLLGIAVYGDDDPSLRIRTLLEQHSHEVDLGFIEFPAEVTLLRDDDLVCGPMKKQGEIDLGWLPLRTSGQRRGTIFQRLRMQAGIIDLTAADGPCAV